MDHYPIKYQAKKGKCQIDRTKTDYKNADFILHHSDYDPKKFVEALEKYGALSTAVYVDRGF